MFVPIRGREEGVPTWLTDTSTDVIRHGDPPDVSPFKSGRSHGSCWHTSHGTRLQDKFPAGEWMKTSKKKKKPECNDLSIMNRATVSMAEQRHSYFLKFLISVLLDVYPEVGVLDCVVVLIFWGIPIPFSIVASPVNIPTVRMGGFHVLHILSNTLTSSSTYSSSPYHLPPLPPPPSQ